MTTSSTAADTSAAAASSTTNGNRATARRPPPASLARRQVAERLRERRCREESLIVSAVDALARRTSAINEVAAASQALTSAILDLAGMGISCDELAQILDVPPDQLADQPPAGQKAPRPKGVK